MVVVRVLVCVVCVCVCVCVGTCVRLMGIVQPHSEHNCRTQLSKRRNLESVVRVSLCECILGSVLTDDR